MGRVEQGQLTGWPANGFIGPLSCPHPASVTYISEWNAQSSGSYFAAAPKVFCNRGAEMSLFKVVKFKYFLYDQNFKTMVVSLFR